MKIKKLPQGDIDEILNHLDVTAWVLVKTYTKRQISALDSVSIDTITNSGKYIPIREDNHGTKYGYLRRGYKKPYQIKWIRVDEVKFVYNKRNKFKKLVEEFK